jgi:molybdopterin synthase catalytic subunit
LVRTKTISEKLWFAVPVLASLKSATRSAYSAALHSTDGAGSQRRREAIDALKQLVPVWKKELYEGGEQWIGPGS